MRWRLSTAPAAHVVHPPPLRSCRAGCPTYSAHASAPTLRFPSASRWETAACCCHDSTGKRLASTAEATRSVSRQGSLHLRPSPFAAWLSTVLRAGAGEAGAQIQGWRLLCHHGRHQLGRVPGGWEAGQGRWQPGRQARAVIMEACAQHEAIHHDVLPATAVNMPPQLWSARPRRTTAP